jgi:hypothetical protein
LPDEASCAYDIDLRQVQADIQSGKVVYDGVAAEACLDAFAARSCNFSEVFTIPPGCDRAVKGTLADGAACGSGNQCISRICAPASTTTCETATMCCPGTCAATRVAEGGDCSGGHSCAPGTYCDTSGTTPVCKKRGAVGAACTLLLPCAENLQCAKATGATEGTCATYPKRGEACGTGIIDCDDTRDACDAASKTCVARVGVGGDCTAGPERCLVFTKCDATSLKCVAKSALGGACTTNSGCLSSLVCVNGLCEEQPLRPVCP